MTCDCKRVLVSFQAMFALRLISLFCTLILFSCTRGNESADTSVAPIHGWTFFWETDPVGVPVESLSAWNHIAMPDGRLLPDTGYAMFRKVLHVDTSLIKEIAFSLKETHSAYRFKVNGHVLFSNGTVGHSVASEIPQSDFRRASLPLQDSTVLLELEISNYHYINGGAPYPLMVGSPTKIAQRDSLQLLLQGISLGVMLLFFLYYFVAFLENRKETSFLFFALCCLTWAGLVMLRSGDLRIIYLLFPHMSFRCVQTFFMLLFIAMPPLSGYFCRCLYPYRIQIISNNINVVLAVLMGMGVMLFSLQEIAHIFDLYMLTSLFFFIPSLLALLAAMHKKMMGAGIYFAGHMTFTATCLYDTFAHMQHNYSVPPVTAYGALILLFSQAILLSRRMAHIAHDNELLLSDIRNQNMELKRLSQIKDDFLANTTHELRTPLHGITGIAESIIDHPESNNPAFVRENANLILSSARRLASLVNDILDFSKLRHNNLSINPQAVHLGPLLAMQMRSLEPLVKRKGLTLRADIPQDLPALWVDEDRLAQILLNLLGNAVKFTDHGEIVVQAFRQEELIRIAVTDTGIGIPSSKLASIFEAFEQVERPGKTRGGTGLGLSITKRLVELHQGRMEVASVLGTGSTFTIFLPKASEEPAPQAHLDQGQAPSPHSVAATLLSHTVNKSVVPTTILAIDDEPTNLQILCNYLEPQGFKLVCAEHGLNALELIEIHRPALILLDIMMPVQNGYEVCASIRKYFRAEDLPIIFVTARTRMDDLMQGFAAGANDYVVKPFFRAEILNRIQLHLRNHSAIESQASPHVLASQIMQLAIQLWEKSTRTPKADFAEQSGLWKVQTDTNGWRRTQTLDKYLDPNRIPSQPRWQKVLESSRYVLELAEKTGVSSDMPQKLQAMTNDLRKMGLSEAP